MGGLKNILLALVPIVPLIAGVPTSDVGPQLNYVPKSYIVQFKEDVDVAAHAQWARSVHTRNLSKYRKRALPEGRGGVKTIFRQFKYVLFPGWSLSNCLYMDPPSITTLALISLVLTLCRGYIGDFDDLTIEEIKAHPNVVHLGPRADRCLY